MEISTIIAYVLVVFTMFFGMTFSSANGFNIGALMNFVDPRVCSLPSAEHFLFLLHHFQLSPLPISQNILK